MITLATTGDLSVRVMPDPLSCCRLTEITSPESKETGVEH